MSKSFSRFAAALFVCALLLTSGAAAQDFQKSYRVGAGSDIRIGNISGDVTITGYDGDSVVVTATKDGRDRDKVDIEDRSTADRVDVTVRYPERCNCNVDVSFEVKVPRSVSYGSLRFSSVSGSVDVTSVSGKLKASSVSGGVRVRDVTGSVSASAVSGNVEVDIDRLEGADNMKFSSVSGNVTVKLPNNLDAEIEMSSLSGSLKTDFPIEVREKRYGPGRSAHGRVGNGSRSLNMSTVSGSVSLMYASR
jgi:DUF4097 and DUF4098 domain-containing protein YvlB